MVCNCYLKKNRGFIGLIFSTTLYCYNEMILYNILLCICMKKYQLAIIMWSILEKFCCFVWVIKDFNHSLAEFANEILKII